MRIEKSPIVDAVRVLIQINPGLRRPWVGELPDPFDVLVNRIPRSSFCVALPNPDIARHAAHTLRPPQRALHPRKVTVGRTFVHVLRFGEVPRNFRVLLLQQKLKVRVVRPACPIQPTLDPRRIVRIARRPAPLGHAPVEAVHNPVVIVVIIHLPRHHQLSAVVHAEHGVCTALGFRKRRQEQGRKDGDDSDDDQQFDQGKRPHARRPDLRLPLRRWMKSSHNVETAIRPIATRRVLLNHKYHSARPSVNVAGRTI